MLGVLNIEKGSIMIGSSAPDPPPIPIVVIHPSAFPVTGS